MTDHKSKHVFISYVREDQDHVDRLCRDLQSMGVNVWIDRHSITPGARWKDAIREAIRHGDFFIACFSNEYTSKTKSYMNEELTLAIEELRQYDSNREWFIPVLLSECDVPARSIGAGETLLDINWVPLYENWEICIQNLQSIIKPIEQYLAIVVTLDPYDSLSEQIGYDKFDALFRTLGGLFSRFFNEIGVFFVREDINEFSAIVQHCDRERGDIIMADLVQYIEKQIDVENEVRYTENLGCEVSVLVGSAVGKTFVEIESVKEYARFNAFEAIKFTKFPI